MRRLNENVTVKVEKFPVNDVEIRVMKHKETNEIRLKQMITNEDISKTKANRGLFAHSRHLTSVLSKKNANLHCSRLT